MQKNVSVVDVLDLLMEKQVTSCQGFVEIGLKMLRF